MVQPPHSSTFTWHAKWEVLYVVWGVLWHPIPSILVNDSRIPGCLKKKKVSGKRLTCFPLIQSSSSNEIKYPSEESKNELYHLILQSMVRAAMLDLMTCLCKKWSNWKELVVANPSSWNEIWPLVLWCLCDKGKSQYLKFWWKRKCGSVREYLPNYQFKTSNKKMNDLVFCQNRENSKII